MFVCSGSAEALQGRGKSEDGEGGFFEQHVWYHTIFVSIGDIIPTSGRAYIVFFDYGSPKSGSVLQHAQMTTRILAQKLGVQVVDKDLLYPRLRKAVLSV